MYPERGMLDCNTYVIAGSSGVIIDPGSPENVSSLLDDLRQDGIEPSSISTIVNTHLHLDHSWGNEAFKETTNARIIFHPLQKKYYDVSVVKTAQFFGFNPPDFKEDECLEKNEMAIGDLEYQLIPAPGHSLDSVCFYCAKEKVLVCGDVLFAGNTGRADLPGGNAEQLKQSIENLSRLEIEYLLPGHMGIVQGVGNVKQNFDFIREHVFAWM
ncbi:MBL fold metallo-hydrolase [Chloroflexota bacterium]